MVSDAVGLVSPARTAANMITDENFVIAPFGADHPVVSVSRELGKRLQKGIADVAHTVSEVLKSDEQRRRERQRRARGRVIANAGAAAAGALVAVAAAVAWRLWRKKRDGDRRARLLEESGVGACLSGGDFGYANLRDPLPGEQHDIIVCEDVEEGAADGCADAAALEAADAPPGLAFPPGRRAQGAMRRIYARKKFVLEVDRGGVPTSACIAGIVASARLEYAHGNVDPGAAANARSYLVRAMRAAGINPVEMAKRIDAMVVATLVVTEGQKQLSERVEEMKRLNMFNHSKPY